MDVFERCLDAADVTEEERKPLKSSYHDIVKGLLEEDKNDE